MIRERLRDALAYVGQALRDKGPKMPKEKRREAKLPAVSVGREDGALVQRRASRTARPRRRNAIPARSKRPGPEPLVKASLEGRW